MTNAQGAAMSGAVEHADGGSSTDPDGSGPTDGLRLLARDLDDLSVIGTMLQDALTPVRDLRYDPEAKEFIAVFNRFCWERAGDNPPFERCHTALRFSGVERVQNKGVNRRDGDSLLSVLTLAFAPAGPVQPDASEGDQGLGVVVIQFAGDKALRLLVSDLTCSLKDVGERWPTQWRPDHKPDAE